MVYYTVYLPAFTIKINHLWVNIHKYTIHGWYGHGMPPRNFLPRDASLSFPTHSFGLREKTEAAFSLTETVVPESVQILRYHPGISSPWPVAVSEPSNQLQCPEAVRYETSHLQKESCKDVHLSEFGLFNSFNIET